MINNYWEKWKKTAERIGNFQFNLIFSLLYYVLIVPVGVIANNFKDFLSLKNFPEWNIIDNQSKSINELKKQ